MVAADINIDGKIEVFVSITDDNIQIYALNLDGTFKTE